MRIACIDRNKSNKRKFPGLDRSLGHYCNHYLANVKPFEAITVHLTTKYCLHHFFCLETISIEVLRRHVCLVVFFFKNVCQNIMQLLLLYCILSFGSEIGKLVETFSKMSLIFKPVLEAKVAGSVQMYYRRRQDNWCCVCFEVLDKA